MSADDLYSLRDWIASIFFQRYCVNSFYQFHTRLSISVFSKDVASIDIQIIITFIADYIEPFLTRSAILDTKGNRISDPVVTIPITATDDSLILQSFHSRRTFRNSCQDSPGVLHAALFTMKDDLCVPICHVIIDSNLSCSWYKNLNPYHLTNAVAALVDADVVSIG